MGGAQFYTRFSTAETPLLINIADTNYELKKYSQSLGEFGAKLYAYTKEYLLYLGLSGGAPLAKTQFESTNIDFTYTASGVSGVEFGGRSSFQFGFEAAMNWRSYKSTARMTLQDFSIGAFISFGSSLNQFGVEKYESVFGGGGSGGGSSR